MGQDHPGETLDPDDSSVEAILDTIGNAQARTVLAAISREPRSALELAEDLDISRSSVYRRLDDLVAYDLVKEETRVADDGNHYTVFECNFNSTLVSLEDDEYDVRIFREEDLPDRFAELWDELGRY